MISPSDDQIYEYITSQQSMRGKALKEVRDLEKE